MVVHRSPPSFLLGENATKELADRGFGQLRAEFGPNNPPVVFCTTETEMTAIIQAIETGAQEYIMKPFDEEILVGKFAQVGLL